MPTKILIKIVSLFILFGSANIAYSANTYPTSWNYPGDGSTNYSFGNSEMMFAHRATSTLAGITSFEPMLCRYLGTGAGTITLTAWYNGTSTPYSAVASSTIQASTIPNCIADGLGYIGSTTPFVFNRSFTVSTNDNLYFILQGYGLDGGLYMSADLITTATNFIWYASSTSAPYTYTGKQLNTFAKIGSGYNAYSTTWADLVSASLENTCDGIFECAIAWAFVPSSESIALFQSINFASSSPFGYMYDMDDALQSFMSGLNATSSNFKITLDMTTLGTHADVFRGVSTSSITVFDVCWVNRELGELPANSFRDRFLPIVVFMMWIGLGWLFYSVSHKIW